MSIRQRVETGDHEWRACCLSWSCSLSSCNNASNKCVFTITLCRLSQQGRLISRLVTLTLLCFFLSREETWTGVLLKVRLVGVNRSEARSWHTRFLPSVYVSLSLSRRRSLSTTREREREKNIHALENVPPLDASLPDDAFKNGGWQHAVRPASKSQCGQMGQAPGRFELSWHFGVRISDASGMWNPQF